MTRLQRSIKLLESQGWVVQKVEQWNSFAKKRKDLFGFIDVLAMSENMLVGVQVTAGSGDVAKHIRKIQDEKNHELWLRCKGRSIVIHSWEKRGPRGKRKVWTCNATHIGKGGSVWHYGEISQKTEF